MKAHQTTRSNEPTIDETTDQSGDQGPDISFRKEHIGLVFRFVAIALLAPLIGWMLARMWVPESLSFQITHDIANAVAIGDTTPMELVASFGIGVFVGLLGLFTVDWRKRYQGALLLIGTIAGLLTLATQGLLLVNIDFTDIWNIAALLFGISVGCAFEYPQLRRLWERGNRVESEDVVFPRAVTGIFVFLSLLVIVGLVESILVGSLLLVPDVPASVAFIYLLFGFIKYDATADVAVVGPRESGKSLLLLGLYLTYRDQGAATDARGYMEDLIDEADSMDEQANPSFPIGNTPELEELSFKLISGTYFPKRVEISVTDFAGELLETLSEHAEEKSTFDDRVTVLKAKLKQHFGSDLNENEKVTKFSNELESPSVMVLLLDMERVRDHDISHVSHLKQLGKRAQRNGSDVIIVATKCDLYIDNFAGQTSIIDNPLKQGLAHEFEDELTESLTNSFNSIEELVNDIGDGRIYPVYYETEDTETGLRPELDKYGNLQHRGTYEVADAIETRL